MPDTSSTNEIGTNYEGAANSVLDTHQSATHNLPSTAQFYEPTTDATSADNSNEGSVHLDSSIPATEGYPPVTTNSPINDCASALGDGLVIQQPPQQDQPSLGANIIESSSNISENGDNLVMPRVVNDMKCSAKASDQNMSGTAQSESVNDESFSADLCCTNQVSK